MFEYLKSKCDNDPEEIVMIFLDYCSYYRSKSVIKYSKKLSMNFLINSPY